MTSIVPVPLTEEVTESESIEKEYVVMVQCQGFATIKAKGKAELDKKVEMMTIHDFDWEPLFDIEYDIIEERETK